MTRGFTCTRSQPSAQTTLLSRAEEAAGRWLEVVTAPGHTEHNCCLCSSCLSQDRRSKILKQRWPRKSSPVVEGTCGSSRALQHCTAHRQPVPTRHPWDSQNLPVRQSDGKSGSGTAPSRWTRLCPEGEGCSGVSAPDSQDSAQLRTEAILPSLAVVAHLSPDSGGSRATPPHPTGCWCKTGQWGQGPSGCCLQLLLCLIAKPCTCIHL